MILDHMAKECRTFQFEDKAYLVDFYYGSHSIMKYFGHLANLISGYITDSTVSINKFDSFEYFFRRAIKYLFQDEPEFEYKINICSIKGCQVEVDDPDSDLFIELFVRRHQ